MKKVYLTLGTLAMLSIGIYNSCGQSAKRATEGGETDYTMQPTVVHVGREVPRTHTLSYSSKEASIERSRGKSAYIQPLSEEWTKSAEGDKCGIYTHRFTVPFTWVDRQVFVYVGSAKGAYQVIINGVSAGYNQSAATAAEFDISGFTKEGANTLEIKVYKYNPLQSEDDTRLDVTDLLDGEVYIFAQPKVRIRDYVATTSFTVSDATVQLGVIMKTHLLNTKTVRLYYELLSPTGEEVASGHRDVEIDKQREEVVRFLLTLPNARAWSHETPALYTLLLKTQHEGRFTEYVAYTMGLRTMEASDGALLINSFKAPLQAAEMLFRGDSTQTYAHLADLKSKGINLVKVKESPQPEYFYDICDQIGMYVCNQAAINTERYGFSRAKGGNPTNNPEWRESYIDRVTAMYYTSHNHPSTVMFSLATNSSNGYNLYESYTELREIEKLAPIIYLDAEGEWNSDAISASIQHPSPAMIAKRVVLDFQRVSNLNDDLTKHLESVTTQMDVEKRVCTVTNNLYITRLYGLLHYTVKQGSKRVSSGSIKINIDPQKSIEVAIPVGDAKSNKPLKYDVKFESLAAIHDHLPMK